MGMLYFHEGHHIMSMKAKEFEAFLFSVRYWCKYKFKSIVHTMVITGHSLYRLLWPIGTRSGATPSLYTSWAMPAALGITEIEGEIPNLDTYLSTRRFLQKLPHHGHRRPQPLPPPVAQWHPFWCNTLPLHILGDAGCPWFCWNWGGNAYLSPRRFLQKNATPWSLLTTSRTTACGPLARVLVQHPPSAHLRKCRMCLVCWNWLGSGWNTVILCRLSCELENLYSTINQCGWGRREATAADNKWGSMIGCAVRRGGVRRDWCFHRQEAVVQRDAGGGVNEEYINIFSIWQSATNKNQSAAARHVLFSSRWVCLLSLFSKPAYCKLIALPFSPAWVLWVETSHMLNSLSAKSILAGEKLVAT